MECEPNPECKYFNRGCFNDVHHRHYPKNEYNTPIERQFRNLEQNKEEMCRSFHEELHATQEPPEKPTVGVMAQAILESEVFISKKMRKVLKGAA